MAAHHPIRHTQGCDCGATGCPEVCVQLAGYDIFTGKPLESYRVTQRIIKDMKWPERRKHLLSLKP